MGRRGATLNIGKRGVKSTVGLPGTGLSYSTMLSTRKASPARPAARLGLLVVIAVLLAVAILAAH